VRLLHSADWHIAVLTRTLGERSAYRRANASLKGLVECVKRLKPEVLIISGDVFHHHHPSSLDMLLFIRTLAKVLKLGITVLIIPGNHDCAGKRAGTALDFLAPLSASFSNLHIAIRKPKVVVIDNTTFVMWPWNRLPKKKDKKLIKNTPRPRIGILHVPIWGARMSKDGAKLLSGFSIEVANKTMKEMDLKFLLLGHVHEFQVMSKGRVIYPGSLLQTKFNETPRKGVVFLDTNKDKVKFIPIQGPSRLLTVDSIDKVRKRDIYQLSLTSKEEAMKVLPYLPGNVVKVNYPIRSKVSYDESDAERKKVGWKISLIPIVLRILQKQGVKDIKSAVKYLVSILGSKDDLILP